MHGVSRYQQVTQSIDNFTHAAGFLSNNSNGPASDTQWGVSVYNPGSSSVTISTVTFYAICAVAN